MFDIGFLEILIVAVLTLVVVGPERLPATIHFVGRWVGKIRESFNAVRVEIEREVQAEEFKKRMAKTINEVNDGVKGVENSIADTLQHASVSEENFSLQPPGSGKVEDDSPGNSSGNKSD